MTNYLIAIKTESESEVYSFTTAEDREGFINDIRVIEGVTYATSESEE